MADMYDRTRLLIGEEGIRNLQNAHVCVAGVGGVGSFVVEALVRAGVGTVTIIDNDTVDLTNLNRQIHATRDTIGRPKVEVMEERIHSIQPETVVYAKQELILKENAEEILGEASYDYIVDAVDSVTAKLALVLYAKKRNIPVISSMGTANKLDATKFEVTDISKTHTCPLARVMRKELRDRGIEKGVEVLYSSAKPVPVQTEGETQGRRTAPGSISYVPSVAGLLLAGHVIENLLIVTDSVE